MSLFIRLILIVVIVISITGCSNAPDEPANIEPAKNVILFIGDGMGVSTVTAARIFDGQSRGEPGEENFLSFERFPYVSLVKTYNTNQQVPDSAGTATAMHTGYKTKAGVINVGPQAHRRNCKEAAEFSLETIGARVKRDGKALGIVTTTRVTHATPATVYAQSPERDWESDLFMGAAETDAGCVDIARQLVEFGTGGGIDLVLGGGAREFFGSQQGGIRKADDADLAADWKSGGSNRVVVRTSDELKAVTSDQSVLGLFSQSHMTYIAERKPDTSEPTIQEMTAMAIDHLEARGTGYYLLVEGGRIDHGHHDGKPGWAFLETQAFAEAVQTAIDKVDLEETLVLVTADHSHVFTMAGYPTRGNPILGLVVENDKSGRPKDGPAIAGDGRPFTSVGYANGPGAVSSAARPHPETGADMIAQALVPMSRPEIDGSISDSETHAGEDVALYATGNGAECVRGVIEQDRVFDVISAAFGWREAC